MTKSKSIDETDTETISAVDIFSFFEQTFNFSCVPSLCRTPAIHVLNFIFFVTDKEAK